MSDGSELGAALARLFPGLPTGPEADYRAVFDALQCAADVRTLDDWHARTGHRPFRAEEHDGHWLCHSPDAPLESDGHGATPDEARAKAAAWAREQMKGTKP